MHARACNYKFISFSLDLSIMSKSCWVSAWYVHGEFCLWINCNSNQGYWWTFLILINCLICAVLKCLKKQAPFLNVNNMKELAEISKTASVCVLAANFVDTHWKPIFRAENLADAFVQQVSWQLCMKSYFLPFTGTGQRLRFAFGDIALIVSLEAARALKAS